MKVSLTVISILFLFLIVRSQSTVVDYTIIGNESSEYSTDLDTLNGSIYLVGNTNECGSSDGFILKYKEDSIYSRTIIGTENIDIIESVETTSTDTIFIGGFTNRNSDYNIFLAKLDTQLTIVKTKEIEVDNWNFCYDLAINNNTIVGVGKSHNGVDYDAFIFKVNSNLDTLWTKTIAISKDQELKKVIKYNDSVYITCGYTQIDGLGKDIYLVSFNVNTGDTLWTKHIGGLNDDFCNSIIKTADGGIVGFGTTSSYTSSNEDTFLFKVDSLGVFMWSNLHQVQTASNTLNEEGVGLVELLNGDLVVVAFTESFGGPGVKSTMVMKTTSSGDWLNGYIYDGGHDDFPTSMIKMSDTSFYISGIANSNSFGYTDSYLLHIRLIDVNNTINLKTKELKHWCYVEVDEEKRKNEEQFISPNPINSQFQINSTLSKFVTISIFSLSGSVVFKIKVETNIALTFPSYLPKGFYVIEVIDKGIINYYKVVYAK